MPFSAKPSQLDFSLRYFPDSFGVGKKNQEKGPSSAVENRKRFSTADEGPLRLAFFSPSHRWLGKKIFRNRRRRSSAVENRKRFSTAEVEKKNLGFVLLPFGQLDKSVIAQKIACDFLSDLRFFFSRKKNLRSFFLYFPRLLRSREKSVLFLKEKGPEKKNLGFVLLPFGQLDKSVIAQKIACDFLSDLRFIFSRRGKEPNVQIPPRGPDLFSGPFSERKRTDFSRLAFFFPLPLRGRGNKILPFFPIHVFFSEP